MKLFEKTDTARIPYSLLLAAAPAVYLTVKLKPEGPFVPLVVFLIAVNVLYFLRSRLTGSVSRVVTTVIFLMLLLGSAVVFIDIIITPYSAYLTWFSLVADNDQAGAISYLFVMTEVLFSSIIAGAVYRRLIVRPFIATVLVNSVLAALVFQNREFFWLSITVLAVLLILISVKGYRGKNIYRAAVSSFSVLAVAVIIAAVFTSSAVPRGSRIVDSSLSPALRELIVSTFPDFPIIYGIPGYGFSFDRRSLGKTPVLSQRTIFEVRGTPGQTIYLRTAVYNVYAGNNWKVGKELLDKAENGSDITANAPPAEEYADSITVTLMNDFYSMVPHTLDTVSFSFHRKRETEFSYASKDTGYLLAQPLVNGDEVVLYEMPTAPQPAAIAPESYLNLPDHRSRRLVALARSLNRGDPRLTAEAIKDYLSTTEFNYTLSTDHPEDKDLVEYFLFESRKGYCVHFASAFTILARLNDIPTRYVTGFLTHIPREQSTTKVSGYSAHAWPEIWTPENGWTIIEATPPLRYSDDFTDDSLRRYMSDDDYLTSRQLAALTGSAPVTAADEQTYSSSESRFNFSVPVFLYVLLIVGAAVGIFMIASWINSTYLARDNRKRIDLLSSRIASRMVKAGIRHPSVSGWLRWGIELEEAERALPSSNGNSDRIPEVVQLFIRTFYGNYMPDSADVERVKTFNRNLKIGKLKAVKKIMKQS